MLRKPRPEEVTTLVSRLQLAELKGHSGVARWMGSLLRLIDGQSSVSLLSIITLSQLLVLSTGTVALQGEASCWVPVPVWRDVSEKEKKEEERRVRPKGNNGSQEKSI